MDRPANLRSHRLAGIWRHFVIGLVATMVGMTAVGSRAAPAADFSMATAGRNVLQRALVQSAKDAGRDRARRWIRNKIVSPEDMARYGLVLEDEWQQADADKPVVVIVHGYNSCPEQNQALFRSIRAAGFPCGLFAYPNDQALRESSQLLSCELRRFAEAHPERRVALVCHSMGGIVARQCVEDPLYDPGNVDRLIMIAPPSHGTLVAHFAVGTDLWEHWLARKHGGPWARLRDSIVDGLGEAADDLCPDSEFLAELNHWPRNERVCYSILLGTGAALSQSQIDWMRKRICEKLANVPGASGGAEKLDSLLSDLDELVDGKGDGVVAVKRGQLDGVSDTILLPFGHLSVIGPPRTDAVQDVQQAVLERLN